MIRIYNCDIENLMKSASENSEALDTLFRCVDSERREKAEKFRFIPDKVRSLVAGLLIQHALRDYLKLYYNDKTDEGQGRPDSESSFYREFKARLSGTDLLIPSRDYKYIVKNNGKPYIEEYPDFHFSLSHSGHFVVLATGDGPVGIDVQEHDERTNVKALSERFYSDAEIEYLENIPDEAEKRAAFFRLWAAKEAYIKMTGNGLREELNSFTADLVKMEVHTHFPEGTSGYLYETLTPIRNSLMLCFGQKVKKIYTQNIKY